MSTRKVAAEAGVPLSQVHYHFGSKGGLILALLEEENKRRLDRQTRMYAEDRPLWQRYEQACDFLEDDLDSGYVRVLQEMIAAGWSNDQIGKAVHDLLAGWFALLIEVAREAERRHGPLGPFTADEVATLIGTTFIGSESLLLLGFERQGVKVYYEVFGAGEPTVVLLPTWSIIHSRHWKLQVPDLARRHRVVTFDGRGNGRSDRPAGVEAYRPTEFTADALAVMDATGTDRAVLVALSLGATWALELGVLHPERVAGIVFVGAALPLTPMPPARATDSFTERLPTSEGWAKFNQHYWREHYRDFLEF